MVKRTYPRNKAHAWKTSLCSKKKIHLNESALEETHMGEQMSTYVLDYRTWPLKQEHALKHVWNWVHHEEKKPCPTHRMVLQMEHAHMLEICSRNELITPTHTSPSWSTKDRVSVPTHILYQKVCSPHHTHQHSSKEHVSQNYITQVPPSW